MKFVLAAAAFAATCTSASAGGFLFNGYGEYAFEAEALEFGLLGEYFTGPVGLHAGVVLTMPNGSGMDLDHVDLGVTYAVDPNITLYGNVELDQDFDYSETVVGVSFSF